MKINEPISSKPSLGVVIVTYGHELEFSTLLDSLSGQKEAGDQIIVVDNHPEHHCAKLADRHAAVDVTMRLHNVGFAEGCNIGVQQLLPTIELVLLLNPDTLPQKNFLHVLRQRMPSNWAASMPLLTMQNHQINSAGNSLHLSGLSWCDEFGQRDNTITEPHEVVVISGACFCIKRTSWEKLGGFCKDYFMYYEDTDLSLRLQFQGERVGLLPSMHVYHDYDFRKGTHKWFYIERNRYLLIWRIYPFLVILLLMPIFLITEVGLIKQSLVEKRFWLRVKSQLSALKLLPRQIKHRWRIQRTRTLSSKIFLQLLTAELTTPLIVHGKWIDTLFKIYKNGVQKLLQYLPDIKI